MQIVTTCSIGNSAILSDVMFNCYNVTKFNYLVFLEYKYKSIRGRVTLHNA